MIILFFVQVFDIDSSSETTEDEDDVQDVEGLDHIALNVDMNDIDDDKSTADDDWIPPERMRGLFAFTPTSDRPVVEQTEKDKTDSESDDDDDEYKYIHIPIDGSNESDSSNEWEDESDQPEDSTPSRDQPEIETTILQTTDVREFV